MEKIPTTKFNCVGRRNFNVIVLAAVRGWLLASWATGSGAGWSAWCWLAGGGSSSEERLAGEERKKKERKEGKEKRERKCRVREREKETRKKKSSGFLSG